MSGLVYFDLNCHKSFTDIYPYRLHPKMFKVRDNSYSLTASSCKKKKKSALHADHFGLETCTVRTANDDTLTLALLQYCLNWSVALSSKSNLAELVLRYPGLAVLRNLRMLPRYNPMPSSFVSHPFPCPTVEDHYVQQLLSTSTKSTW